MPKWNTKACMTEEILEEWLALIIAEKKKKERKILLCLDNASSHVNLQLSLIQPKFLSANESATVRSGNLKHVTVSTYFAVCY